MKLSTPVFIYIPTKTDKHRSGHYSRDPHVGVGRTGKIFLEGL